MQFADEDPTLFVSPNWRPKNTWCVLMVDDDAQVHTVTRLALRGFEFLNRPLEFISAFSGDEGRQIFETRKDIAVAIVDVVMESEQAGLELIHYVRNVLQNHRTRLVVRTGQPGMASRHSVTQDYEIDDYEEKTDLTIQKLRAMLNLQLSAYQSFGVIEP